MARDVDMKRIQMVGDQSDLRSGPLDMIADDFPGGMEQMVGSTANISRRTDPMGSFEGEYSKHISGGKVEFIGQTDLCPVDRTARRGWDSYSTPISKNTEPAEKRVSNYPSKGQD
jgi:hypothetical protein